MANGLQGLLASLLNSNPGMGGLLSPGGYQQSTGLAPEQLQRYHAMSGMGQQAPQAAPPSPAMAPQAPAQPDMTRTASTAPSGGGFGDMLGNLFMPKTAQRNKTVQLLMQDGLDEGTATLVAGNKTALQQYLTKRAFPDQQNRATATIDGKLIDTNTGQVIGDYGDPKEPSLVNAGDGNLYDPQSGQWITAPNAGQKPPQVVEIFDDATGQPYKATWNAEKGEYERVGGVKARTGMQLTTNPDGTVTFTEGSIGGMPKLTEAEGRNAGFFGRAAESHKLLSDLEQEGTSLWNRAAGGVPVVGNYALGPDAQKFQQAQRDFINAVLRRESGAVISPEEFENAKLQYFPQPGDGPEVIEQKRKNRDTTILGLKISGGQGSQFAIPGGSAPAAPPAAPGEAIPPTGRDRHVPTPKRLKFNPATGELE